MISKQDILNASVLIVDDQPSNVMLLKEMLREAGYNSVATTSDPYEVCALHQKNNYALILLDLQMPGMDGFEVMENLKEIETDDYLPVIAITAEPGHKLRALKAGAKDFISKPFDLVEVQTRIHNMLEVRLLYKQLKNHNQTLEQTVQKRTAELQQSEERFRRLTELSSDWYWEQDKDGKFFNIYGPVLEMLGILTDDQSTPQESHVNIWNADERQILETNIAARKPFLDFVYSRTNPDGTLRYLMVSGEPMFDPTGRFTGYRGIGKDVTDAMSAKDKSGDCQ
ncbi:MAG: response regulator [Methylococcaceae bacterium]|nr:response regulator [Methylococcaceae bacterium]